MPKYKLVNNIFIDNETKEAGSVIDLPADKAEGFLERGSIIEYDENATEETVSPPERTGEVVDTVTLNDVEYKHLRDAEGDFYLMGDELVDENAFTAAKQAKVKEDIAEDHAAGASSLEPQHEEVEPPTDPLADQSGSGQDGQQNSTPSENQSDDTADQPPSSSPGLHLN